MTRQELFQRIGEPEWEDFSPAHPRVRIFTNHIEYYNPGGLPKPLEELKGKDLSIPRNPVIAKLFRMVKLAENAGYGLDKMDENWKAYNNSAPVFDIAFDSTIVKLFTTSVGSSDTGVENVTLQPERMLEEFRSVSEQLGENVEDNMELLRSKYGVFTGYLRGKYGVNADKIKATFNERSLWILMLVTINPSFRRDDISTLLGVSLSTIEKDILKLKRANVLSREGSDKTGYWVIIKA